MISCKFHVLAPQFRIFSRFRQDVVPPVYKVIGFILKLFSFELKKRCYIWSVNFSLKTLTLCENSVDIRMSIILIILSIVNKTEICFSSLVGRQGSEQLFNEVVVPGETGKKVMSSVVIECLVI